MGERIMVEELVEEGVQELGRGGDGVRWSRWWR